MTSASALDGTETIECVQSGNTRKTLISTILTYLAGATAWLPTTKLTGSVSVAQMGSSTYAVGSVAIFSLAVNFNAANTDNAIAITLPTGFTRYIVSAVRISGASASITTATCGLFTAAAAAGTAIVTSASAITVSTATEGTNNNSQALTVNNSNTQSYLLSSVPSLYFRTQTAQGSAATANVQIIVAMLP